MSRDVERVIEVGVAGDDGVGARRVARDGGDVGDEPADHATAERSAREIRIEEHDRRRRARANPAVPSHRTRTVPAGASDRGD